MVVGRRRRRLLAQHRCPVVLVWRRRQVRVVRWLRRRFRCRVRGCGESVLAGCPVICCLVRRWMLAGT